MTLSTTKRPSYPLIVSNEIVCNGEKKGNRLTRWRNFKAFCRVNFLWNKAIRHETKRIYWKSNKINRFTRTLLRFQNSKTNIPFNLISFCYGQLRSFVKNTLNYTYICTMVNIRFRVLTVHHCGYHENEMYMHAFHVAKRGTAGWSNAHECYDKMNAFQKRISKLTCLSFTIEISSAIHGWNINIEFVSKEDIWDVIKFIKQKLKKCVFNYKDIWT